MTSLNQHIKKYNEQLAQGHIQKAYRGIMETLSQLKTTWDKRYPETPSGALYVGYMDMTFIAVKPAELLKSNLRISIVYLHETHSFETWLIARNRSIQLSTHKQLENKQLGSYKLTDLKPGVDAIIALPLVFEPDFDHTSKLVDEIIEKTHNFIVDMTHLMR